MGKTEAQEGDGAGGSNDEIAVGLGYILQSVCLAHNLTLANSAV